MDGDVVEYGAEARSTMTFGRWLALMQRYAAANAFEGWQENTWTCWSTSARASGT